MAKVCTRCEVAKPADEFYRSRLTRDGRQSWCKACTKMLRDERRAADPELRQKEYRRNGEAIRAQVNATRDPERNRAWTRAWREANPERERELRGRSRMARRARQRGALVERFDRAEIWERDAGVCHLCGLPADPADWHLDHVRPLARGGAHTRDNAAVSHPFCNQSKGARLTA